jgi:DNA-binding LytR/AlgR family response regulator
VTTNSGPSILIVDDEELARLRIRRYLERTRPAALVMEAADGVEALEQIARQAPDLLFLDVEMPELSGFDVLRQLEARPFRVVFQTAYDQFAVRAFDENACDYLLKPFTDERLEAALRKALGAAPGEPALAALEAHLVRSQRYLDKLVVSIGKGRARVVSPDDVLYFLSEQHVTRLFLAGIDFAYEHSLTFLEERLDPTRFIRLHRNNVVNVRAIKTVNGGPRASVTLTDGTELPVARDRKAALKALLNP